MLILEKENIVTCILLPLWRRKWQPTPVLMPGESHGQRSLVGYSPWGHKETCLSDFTFTFNLTRIMLKLVNYISYIIPT